MRIFASLFVLLLLSACVKPEQSETLPVTAVEESPRLLHPRYSFTENNLEELCEGLPDDSIIAIRERSQYFLQLVSDVLQEDPYTYRLVNKENGLTRDEAPADLVELDEYKDRLSLSRQGHRLRRLVLPDLMAMVEAAGQEGIDLKISSAYRPYDYQEMLFKRYAERDGVEEAERYSARPGNSQHQLGTAIDFGSIDDNFALTPAGQWLKEHSREYGFSLSYPEGMEEYTGYIWESWHFRYTGRKACELETVFFGGIQERALRFLHEKGGLIRAASLP